MSVPSLRSIAQSPFLALPLTSAAAAAVSSIRSGEVVVVLDEDSRPVGILDDSMLPPACDLELPLSSYREHFAPPALTTIDTPVESLLQGMAFDPAIRWHVVLEGARIVGIVKPADLFQFLDVGPATLGTPALTRLFGDPIAPPPSLCYVCKGKSPHRVSAKKIEQRDSIGRALCPDHGTVMIAENPCQGRAR